MKLLESECGRRSITALSFVAHKPRGAVLLSKSEPGEVWTADGTGNHLMLGLEYRFFDDGVLRASSGPVILGVLCVMSESPYRSLRYLAKYSHSTRYKIRSYKDSWPSLAVCTNLSTS
jgi:hypothetical protein